MMWKEKYKIGVPLIDQQHEELFKRVSKFIQIVQNKDASWDERLEGIKDTMAFMQEYVVFHFDDEEAYQAEINYPGLEEHKKIHADFKAGVAECVDRIERENYSQESVQEFSAKIMTWLIMHVAGVDQKIGEYVKDKGGDK